MVLQQRSSCTRRDIQLKIDPQSSLFLVSVKSSSSSTHSTNQHKPQFSPDNDVGTLLELQSTMIGKKRNINVTDLGFPGHLTKSEFKTFVSLVFSYLFRISCAIVNSLDSVKK